MRKLIIPLWDIRLQRNVEELRSEEMSTACKDTKKSVENENDSSEVENENDSSKVENESDSSKVENENDSSEVENENDSSEVENENDSSEVENENDSSKVENENDSSEVESENDSSEEDDDSEDPYSEGDDENKDPDYEGKMDTDDSSGEGRREDPDYKDYGTVKKKKINKRDFKVKKVKADLSKALKEAYPPKKQYVRKREKIKVAMDPPVVRKSRRLENVNTDFSEYALIKDAERKNTIPPEFSFKDAFKNEHFYERYVADVPIQESKSETTFITYTKSDLQKMTVKESNVVKIVPHVIDALAWYPLPDQLILAAGDLKGNLGVWNVKRKSDPYVMNIHLEGITNLQFSPFDPVKLISSSSDGTVRCGDMVRRKFNEIYKVSNEACTYFDILSASTFIVSQMDGQVAVVDKRTERSLEKKHDCHDYMIRSVHIHPVKRRVFVTAADNGSIRLWDLRKLQKEPMADIAYHKECVNSAFFSPITGNSILATSTDNTVSIFDSSSLRSEIELKNHMEHENKIHTKRGRATWLPNSEEAFMIGSSEYPPKIEVYDKDMHAYSIMMDGNFTKRAPNNAFHPTTCALAGASYRSTVFVFR